jgi:2-polyprenyl-6-methoxyphenol hydroxylase-like FAD-dependent oxidoreductase
LGIGLLKIGLSVMVVDKAEAHQSYAKALIIDSQTVLALNKCGISDIFPELGIALNGCTFNVGERRILRVPLNTTDPSKNHAVVFPLNAIDDILVQTFTKLGGQIIKGALFEPDVNPLLKFSGHEPMDIVLNYDGVRFPVRCNWLFGCDGIHSAVRSALLIEYSGITEEDDRHVIDAVVQRWPYPTHINYWFTFFDTRSAELLLLEPLTVRIVAPNKAACECLLYACGVESILYSGRFSHSYRVAKSYGREHIWLVGDATATFSPVGSRGHNVGMLDAMQLVSAIQRGDVRQYEKTCRPSSWYWAVYNFAMSQLLMSERWSFRVIRVFLFVASPLIQYVADSILLHFLMKIMSLTYLMIARIYRLFQPVFSRLNLRW